MNKIGKFTMVVAKILELLHWIGMMAMGASIACVVVAGDGLRRFLESNAADLGDSLTTYGFEVSVVDQAGHVNLTGLLLFAVGAVLILGLMAMIWRNIYLIVKRSQNATPFQKDNVRMLREIGIFAISMPVIGLVISTVVFALCGPEGVEVSVSMDGFALGLVVLCLTQVFAHGIELESDVDGLL